jgi:predicted deacylase
VKYADMEISIHSGGSHSYLAEAMFAATDSKTQELARAMGEDWRVCLYSNVTSKSPMAVMSELGKPALTVELGGRSSTAPGAFLNVGKTLLKACINILTHYKMLKGTAHYPSVRHKGFQQALLAPKSGIFLPNPEIKFLSMMKKNDHIATIIDYYGNELCTLIAPEDGMIFGLRALPNVTIGEWCCFFAIIEGEW